MQPGRAYHPSEPSKGGHGARRAGPPSSQSATDGLSVLDDAKDSHRQRLAKTSLEDPPGGLLGSYIQQLPQSLREGRATHHYRLSRL